MRTVVFFVFSESLHLDGFLPRYKIVQQGESFTFHLGKSHLDVYNVPEKIKAKLISPTEILLMSHDRCALGMAVHAIQSLRPVEPYKGKGIRKKGQIVIIKKREKSA